MLRFDEYLYQQGISLTGFARRLSARLGRVVSVQSVHRWSRPPGHPGRSLPKPAMLVAIRDETGGAVDIASWYGLAGKPGEARADIAA